MLSFFKRVKKVTSKEIIIFVPNKRVIKGKKNPKGARKEGHQQRDRNWPRSPSPQRYPPSGQPNNFTGDRELVVTSLN